MNGMKPSFMTTVVVLSLCFVSVSAAKHDQKLRFGENGQFKILQVADMHYADGEITPCEDVLPSQVPGCSDLNTTAFLNRMISAEKPHFIVFTGISFFFLIFASSLFLKLFYKNCLIQFLSFNSRVTLIRILEQLKTYRFSLIITISAKK